MAKPLLVFHGHTMNGDGMRTHLEELVDRIPSAYDVTYASAPHVCSEGAVERLYKNWGVPREPGPYLTWWDATDDGRVYRGWDETRIHVQRLLEQHPGAGILGFSQGAILAAAVAALANAREFPDVAFVICVAGRTPRADVLKPYFDHPVVVPSLHVWGEADPLASGSAELAERFHPDTRELAPWKGSHRVPARGPGADAIVGFLERHAGGFA